MGSALAPEFAADIQRVHLEHFDFEKLLHGLANLNLVRARVGHHGVLVELLALARSFFRHADGLDDVKSVHVISASVRRVSETRRA